MHLRWAGAGAYGEACASRDPVWYRLKTLKLGVLNPYTGGRLSESQIRLFEKIFADYLLSFRKTLTRLDLSWLGEAGPNPFNVGQDHHNTKLAKPWNRLGELRLGNVTLGCSTSTITHWAPNLRKLSVSDDAANAGQQMLQKYWEGCQGPEPAGQNKDNASWMSSRDVRSSAIPEPLFQHHLA